MKSIIKKYKIKKEINKLYKNIKKMEDEYEYEGETKISGHGDPISFKRLEQLKEKSENSTCKIDYMGNLGTGFFFKYNKDKYYFMTNNHVLNDNEINNNELVIIYKNKEEIINLNGDRLKLTNEDLDYTIIEILKEDEIFKKIKDYFEIDNFIMNNESKNKYKDQDICIVQYPYGGDLSFAQGGINSFKNYKIKHLVSTHHGSSGSPILLQNTFKIIGIHAGNSKKNKNENIGIFMKDILIDCFNIKNEIICEYNIKKKGHIRILNSFEEGVRNNNYFKGKGIENEKEIKDNCEIYLNENKIDFCYKYELEGNNIIKIKCINLLNNTNFMFSDCSSLNSLNLSKFNSNNVNNMSYMFSYCSSLISLNLYNFNTNNVKDMSGIFHYIKKNKCKLICYDNNLKKEFDKMQ